MQTSADGLRDEELNMTGNFRRAISVMSLSEGCGEPWRLKETGSRGNTSADTETD